MRAESSPIGNADIIANAVNARLVVGIGSERMLIAGAASAALFRGALAIVVLSGAGVWGLIVTQFLFSSMNGLILANGVTGALSTITKRAGAASAVVGAIQYGSGI